MFTVKHQVLWTGTFTITAENNKASNQAKDPSTIIICLWPGANVG